MLGDLESERSCIQSDSIRRVQAFPVAYLSPAEYEAQLDQAVIETSGSVVTDGYVREVLIDADTERLTPDTHIHAT